VDGVGDCEALLEPEPETCGNDGTDDDCNGEVDDIADLGEPPRGRSPQTSPRQAS
jgi:hypothetical protein